MTTYTGYRVTAELSDDRLHLSRVGLLAKAVAAEVVVPLDALVETRMKAATPLVNGYLQVVLADDPDPQPGKPSDPYTIVFRRSQQKEMQELRDLLDLRIKTAAAGGVDTGDVAVDRVVGALEGKVLASRAREDSLRAKALSAGVTFAGITLHEGHVRSKDGGGPVAGARATIDKAGELSKRITVTRLVLTGPLALGWRKKQDNRELYLLVEGQGWAVSAPVDPKRGAEARAFAAKINAAGSRIASPAAQPAPTPTSAEPPPPELADPLEQIRKLGELRDAGVLTTEEFEAKKAALLDRL